MKQENKAYNQAIEVLHICATGHGFVASQQDIDNYKRVFARDGVIASLAALQTSDVKLHKAARATLDTLAKYQGRFGQIPSNVDVSKKKISYGQTAGRLDATMWYVIGCGAYMSAVADKHFLTLHTPHIKQAMQALGTWELNEKDFVYMPASGDWADEMPYHGYLLLDQLLYLRAITAFLELHLLRGAEKAFWQTKEKRLRKRLEINFWPDRKYQSHELVYFSELYSEQIKHNQTYWLAGFHPHNWYRHYDGFANIMALVVRLGSAKQQQMAIAAVEKNNNNRGLAVAQQPVITPQDKAAWKLLRNGFRYRFKEKPYEYQNGGLWPMLTGFYIAALMQHNQKDLAQKYYTELSKVVLRGKGFPEYVHGKTLRSKGVMGMAWSAAGVVMAHHALGEHKIILQ